MTEKVEVQQREVTDRGKKGNFYSSCSPLKNDKKYYIQYD